jgi:hypothetical protein
MLDINSIKRFPTETEETKILTSISDFEDGKRSGKTELAGKLTAIFNEKGFIDLGDIVNAMQETKNNAK